MDRIKGSAKQAEGTVRETLGKISGDAGLEAEGGLRKLFGKVKGAFRKA